MIQNIYKRKNGVEYQFADDAPDDAREQLSEAGNPTNPSVANDVLDEG